MGRRIASILLALLGALVLLVAGAAWWLEREVLDEDRFTATVVGLLDRPSARTTVADELRGELLLAMAVDQLAPGTVEATVADPAFAPIFERAVRDVHRFMTDPGVASTTVELRGYTALLAATAGRADPGLVGAIEATAADLPGAATGEAITLTRTDLPPGWDVVAGAPGATSAVAGTIGLLLVAASLVLHPRWTAALGWAGGALVTGGLLVALAAWTASAATTAADPDEAAAAAFVDAASSSLVTTGLVLAVIGVAATVAATVAARRRAQPPTGTSPDEPGGGPDAGPVIDPDEVAAPGPAGSMAQ